MFKLEGKVSYLIPFDDDHLNNPTYFTWLRNYEVVRTINCLNYICPISFDEVKEYYENLIKSKNDMFFAIYFRENDKFIGTIRVNRINWYTRIANIGILIGEQDYWGKGVATDSIFVIAEYLFRILGMRKLVGNYMEINPGMGKVFNKLGFKVEGKFRKADSFEGEYIDHIYVGCLKEEFNWKYENISKNNK